LHHFVRHPGTDFEAQVDWIQLAGCAPRIAHQIDRLELVEGLILAEYGVRLLPVGRPTGSCVKVIPLADPTVVLTAYAVTQTGRATRSPPCAVLDRLRPPPITPTESWADV